MLNLDCLAVGEAERGEVGGSCFPPIVNIKHSELSLRRTPLGPSRAVCLREVSVLKKV